ncbi:helix-turn-helix domain-containing protein [Catellatospora sp. NPDC049133]|uniref:helix-turn-helix domain-containing protein n=1 Tax=Catellatospora sp. NPDC049133 TaxID=3155499 RepID=UPI0033FE8F4E
MRDVTGVKLSESIIAYYIRGERIPGLDTAALLARFFGVSAGYFTDDDVSAVDKDLEGVAFLRQLKEASVSSAAGRLGNLSAADLHTLESIIGAEVRRRNGEQGEPVQ